MGLQYISGTKNKNKDYNTVIKQSKEKKFS